MNVACPQCASVFRVDPAKVPAGGVRARCSICGGVIPVPEAEAAIATPAAGVRAVAPPADAPPAAAEPAPGPAGAPAVTAAPAAEEAPAGAPTSTGTHVNPYLARDPHQRAKRLARALASDIATYYPDKHAEGLRDDNLKELFDEEIAKSYEDYLTQVGAELAESTTYFQDALNEVLAGGKRVF